MLRRDSKSLKNNPTIYRGDNENQVPLWALAQHLRVKTLLRLVISYPELKFGFKSMSTIALKVTSYVTSTLKTSTL